MKLSRFSLFKGTKRHANQFSYTSRFYNEKKEEMEKRKSRLDQEIALANEDHRGEPTVKSFNFRRRENSQEFRNSYKRQATQSNVVIIILVILLCFIGYAVLKYLETANV